MATSSRSRTRFAPEYIDHYETDELSDRVKGAAVWAEYNGLEGYFIFDPKTKSYHQIHYLEDRRIWCFIDYSATERRWYTIRPVPLKLNVGPLKSSNPSGIDIDQPDTVTFRAVDSYYTGVTPLVGSNLSRTYHMSAVSHVYGTLTHY